MADELPRSVIAEDHKLEKTAAGASEMLAELRWHWTLDETNTKRVGLRQYAKAVGRAHSVIHKYAHGYALAKSGHDIATTDAIERAGMSADREAATQAVAKARGVAFTTARQSRPTEVRRVLDIARERVEQHGGTVEDETRKAAKWIVRAEESDRDRKVERSKRLGLRLVELEGHLDAARRRLETALTVARAVDWEDDQQELLRSTLENVRALLNLIDIALAGAPDVDWDAELEALRMDMT